MRFDGVDRGHARAGLRRAYPDGPGNSANVTLMDRLSWWSVIGLIALALLVSGPPMVDWFGLMVLVAIGWAILHSVRRLDRAMDPWRMPRADSSTPLPPPPRPD